MGVPFLYQKKKRRTVAQNPMRASGVILSQLSNNQSRNYEKAITHNHTDDHKHHKHAGS